MDDIYWSFSETAANGQTLDVVYIDTVTWAGKQQVAVFVLVFWRPEVLPCSQML